MSEQNIEELLEDIIIRLDKKLETNKLPENNTILDAYTSSSQTVFTLKVAEMVFDALDKKYANEIKILKKELAKKR